MLDFFLLSSMIEIQFITGSFYVATVLFLIKLPILIKVELKYVYFDDSLCHHNLKGNQRHLSMVQETNSVET